MATIINGLEVILEQPQQQAPQSEATPPDREEQPALRPVDLADIAERQMRQLARLTAH